MALTSDSVEDSKPSSWVERLTFIGLLIFTLLSLIPLSGNGEPIKFLVNLFK